MKTKRFFALLLTAVLLAALGGCQSTDGTAESTETDSPLETAEETAQGNAGVEEVTVADQIGREVTVTPGTYTRVVCIGAGALRMYSYIGDVSLLCGVEDIDNTSLSDRPQMFDSVARPYVIANEEVFRSLPSCGVGGPNAQTAEAEKILSCDPDLVISEYKDADEANALQEQLGVPVITLSSGGDGVFNEELQESFMLLGVLFDREERALELCSYIDREAEEISSRTADIAEEDRPGVYIGGLGSWGTTTHLTTAQNYSAFSVANIRNVVSGLMTDGVQEIEEEKFVALGEDIDILILDAAAVKNIAPLYEEDDTLFDTCRAWRDGEVYLQMAYNAYYTNYEIALANTWFAAKTVYPEAFADVDMTEKLNEITEMFLGKEMAEEIFACPSSFGGYQKIDTETFFG